MRETRCLLNMLSYYAYRSTDKWINTISIVAKRIH